MEVFSVVSCLSVIAIKICNDFFAGGSATTINYKMAHLWLTIVVMTMIGVNGEILFLFNFQLCRLSQFYSYWQQAMLIDSVNEHFYRVKTSVMT